MNKVEKVANDINIKEFSTLVGSLGNLEYSFWNGRIVTDQHSKKTYSYDNLVEVFKAFKDDKKTSLNELNPIFNKLKALRQTLPAHYFTSAPQAYLLAGLIGTAALTAFYLLGSYSFGSKGIPECKPPSWLDAKDITTYCQSTDKQSFIANWIHQLKKNVNTCNTELSVANRDIQVIKAQLLKEQETSKDLKTTINIQNLKMAQGGPEDQKLGIENNANLQVVENCLNKKDYAFALSMTIEFLKVKEWKNPNTIKIIKKTIIEVCKDNKEPIEPKALEALFLLYARNEPDISDLSLEKLFSNPTILNEQNIEHLTALLQKSNLKAEDVKAFVFGAVVHKKLPSQQKIAFDELLQTILVVKYKDTNSAFNAAKKIFENPAEKNSRGLKILEKALSGLTTSANIKDLQSALNAINLNEDDKFKNFQGILGFLTIMQAEEAKNTIYRAFLTKVDTLFKKSERHAALQILDHMLIHFKNINLPIGQSLKNSISFQLKTFPLNQIDKNDGLFKNVIKHLEDLAIYDVHTTLADRIFKDKQAEDLRCYAYDLLTPCVVSPLAGDQKARVNILDAVLKDSTIKPTEFSKLTTIIASLKNDHEFHVSEAILKKTVNDGSINDCKELLHLLNAAADPKGKVKIPADNYKELKLFATLLQNKQSYSYISGYYVDTQIRKAPIRTRYLSRFC